MCVTKIHHVVILHMLKICLLKSQGKFKFKSGKSEKSQRILHQTWLATLHQQLNYSLFNYSLFVE